MCAVKVIISLIFLLYIHLRGPQEPGCSDPLNQLNLCFLRCWLYASDVFLICLQLALLQIYKRSIEVEIVPNSA